MGKLPLGNTFYFIVFFVLIILVKQYLDLVYLVFIFGGVLGFLMPDLDQLIYVYFLEPDDMVSVNARDYFKQRKFLSTFRMLIETKSNRSKLIFHTIQFNLFFLALTFFVLTSSGSIFGHGLTLAFSLRLFIDQYRDYKEFGNLAKWMRQINFNFDREKTRLYLLANLFVILFFGLGV